MPSIELPPAPETRLPAPPDLPPAPVPVPPEARRHGLTGKKVALAAGVGLVIAAVITLAAALMSRDRANTPGRVGPQNLGAALIDGGWTVHGTLTEATGFPALEQGDRKTVRWSFSPNRAGIRVTGEGLGGGILQMTLRGQGPAYRGRAQVPLLSSCGGVPVTDTVTIAIRIVRGEVRDGEWRAARITGTLADRAPATTGIGVSCPAASYTARLVGTPAG